MSEYAVYLFPIVWLASVLMTGWACYHEGRFRGYNAGWADAYKQLLTLTEGVRKS